MKQYLLIKATFLLILFSFSISFAELKVTSTDPNFGVGNSNSEFNKTWLCENAGTTTLNVTLTSSKSGRSPASWGLNNLSENFNLEAGGTQNCGIKLTTNGSKGVGDVNAQIKTNDGFERNVSMTFYTDLYKNIFVNGSNNQNPQETELFKYISTKYSDYIEFTKNDFDNLSGFVQNTEYYFYIGGSDTDIDSSTADKLVDAFLAGKNVFICGSEPFYNLSKTHPNHKVWNVFGFSVSDEIMYDDFNKSFSLQMVNMVEMNSVGDKTFNLIKGNKPIRKIDVIIGGQLYIDKVLWIDGESNKYVGFVKKNLDNNNRIIFVNVDMYGHKLNEEFPSFTTGFYYSLFFENGTSVENNLIETNISPNVFAYPNPVSEFVNIPINEIDKSQILSNDLELKIYDINSNLIKDINFSIENNILKVKTNNLPNSKYFVEINSKNRVYKSNFTIIK